jgi:SAM-dependent methyltransferase
MSELTRSDREKQSYDCNNSFQLRNQRLHRALSHVRETPSIKRATNLFENLIRAAARDGDVLEIGCGTGWQCKRVLELGARTVHGIDISKRMLDAARAIETERLRFFEHDVHQEWPNKYDLIFGRATLHHMDYRCVLSKMYLNNLNPNGQMLFMEPLGENFLLRLYWRLGRAFHTEGEAPFMSHDIKWFCDTFPEFRLYPANYVSLPAAMLSSLFFFSADNVLLRLCDHIDVKISEAIPYLAPRYQSGVFHIQKRT